MKFLNTALMLLVCASCKVSEPVDLQSYFLSFVDAVPSPNMVTSDTLTPEQLQVITEYNLGVYIPKNFKSIVDPNDPEAFIFFNESDKSLLLAKCFPMSSAITEQIEKSTKYDSPVYGPDYNDLSEFVHFKNCEKLISKDDIGPFFFGGNMFVLLGAEYVMHQEFEPRSEHYEIGQFTILFDQNKYLFICSLHNGYSEDMNDLGRWQAFRFNDE